MTKSSLVKLHTTVAQARTRKEAAIRIVLNNIQNYVLVHQDGIRKAPELKVGTWQLPSSFTRMLLVPSMLPIILNKLHRSYVKSSQQKSFTRMLIGPTSTTSGHFTGFESWSNMSLGSKVTKKRSTDCLGQLPSQNATCLRVGRLIFSLWVLTWSMKWRRRGWFEQYRTF
jgi:hypothetical protein